MKVIKLHPHNSAWKYGFTHALRFDGWNTQAARAEDFLYKMYNTATYDRKGPYYSKFGYKHKNANSKPYWINLRNEADITVLLLIGVVDEKS